MDVYESADNFLKLIQVDVSSCVQILGDLDRKFGLRNFVHRKSGDTIGHMAAKHGHVQLLKVLYDKHDFNFSQKNLEGKVPLHDAAQAGFPNCVEYLLSVGSDINSLKRADWTPLMLACTKCDLNVVKVLVEAGACLHLRNKDGWTCFHIASRLGNTDILNYLLDTDGSLWKTESKNGRTPLHTAALHGHWQALKLILDRGEPERDARDTCGSTALMDAARANSPECIDVLIHTHKANLAAEDNLHRQALHLGSAAGAGQSVEHLISEHGQDVNTPTASGATALHIAAREGQAAVLEKLLSLNANLDQKDLKGRTALHIASGCSQKKSVEVLLRHGASDCEDYEGMTAFSLAKRQAIKDLLQGIG